MFQSLFFKIWSAIFLTLLVSVVSIFLIFDQVFKKEFYRYTARQTMLNLEQLEDIVIYEYLKTHSFEKLKEKPELWLKLKHKAFKFNHRPPPPDEPRGANRPPKPEEHYSRFIQGIVLADENQHILAGNYRKKDIYTWEPIKHEGSTIGHLGFIVPKHLLRTIDAEFLTKNGNRLLLLCFVLLVVSSLVAALISRRISVPIKQLSKNTHRLASGDYSVQVPVKTFDEIGNLCNDFNTLARKLAANQEMKNRWVADISHEMRTPVAVLKAQIEALVDGIRKPTTEQLILLAKKIESLSRLIDDLFELSLSDMGSLTYHKQFIDFLSLITNAMENHKSVFEATELTVELHLPEQTECVIFGDEKRLQQVVNNLLQNSARYTDAGGKVCVAVKLNEDVIEFSIEDSAPTVPVELLPKIFERLYRLEISRNRSSGGAGLGLALCQNIVTAHQGKIWAEQSRLGGVKIIVHLPKGASNA